MSLRIAQIVAVASIVAGSFTSAAHAQAPTYDVVFLGPSGGANSSLMPAAVNDHGVVVVNTFFLGGSVIAQVLSLAQPSATLTPAPGGFNTQAYAINNASVVVGATISATSRLATMWTPTGTGYAATALPPTAQGIMPYEAYALNEHGDVVGMLANGKPFAWGAATGTIDLSALGFAGIPRGVNELRQVCGGHDSIDLDTGVIQAGALPIANWSFTHINDAGIAATLATMNFPSPDSCGTYEFGVGPTPFGSGPTATIAGIDYATSVAFLNVTMVGKPIGSCMHYPGIGDFLLASLVDPATPGWSFDFQKGCSVSASGVIVAYGYNPSIPVFGPVLLTPQRFHAILEGAPGIEGLPVLAGEGTLQPSSPVTFRLSHANPSSPVGVIAGLSPVHLPFYGGTLVPAPTLVLTGLSTDANGKLTLTATWPLGLPSGTKLYVQEWIADASAPFGVAGSNALECVVP